MRVHAVTRPVVDDKTGEPKRDALGRVMYEQVDAPFTPEEELERDSQEAAWAADAPIKAAEEVRVNTINAVIAADTTLAQLKLMTADEFDTWWSANVTDLAQANAVLKRLARVVIRRGL